MTSDPSLRIERVVPARARTDTDGSDGRHGRGFLAFVAWLMLVSVAACGRAASEPATWPFAADGSLEPRLVCFVNDTYMGQPQIPVEVDGKVYYGCCAGCAKVLRGDPTSRQAVDPQTHRTVDKAAAFIALDRRDRNHVWYFESPATYRAYQLGGS
jgi:hypothetical protein